MTTISLESQLKCVRREISMRERVYPRFVANGKMSQTKAWDEIDTMKAVLETLQKLEEAKVG